MLIEDRKVTILHSNLKDSACQARLVTQSIITASAHLGSKSDISSLILTVVIKFNPVACTKHSCKTLF